MANSSYKTLNPLHIALDGNHIIEASAGTGKTYNLTSIYTRLISEGRMLPEQILVVTFTEAATDELREKLFERLQVLRDFAIGTRNQEEDEFVYALVEKLTGGKPADSELIAHIEEAIRSFDEAAIHTIHSFCQKTLVDFAFLSGAGFDTDILPDESELFQESADDFWRSYQKQFSNQQSPFWIPYLMDAGYDPEQLKQKVGRHSSRLEEMSVIPGEESESIENLLNDFNEHVTEGTEIIENSGDEARRLVLEAIERKVLHGGSYKKPKVDRAFALLDELAEHGFTRYLYNVLKGGSEQEKLLRLLKGTHLEAKTNKKHQGDTPEHALFNWMDALYEFQNRFREAEYSFLKEAMRQIRGRLATKKRQSGVRGYDDLLHDLDFALNQGGTGGRLASEIRQSYNAALIDEFQDTDQVQYRIFNKIYGEEGDGDTALFLIGDPKQSIYGFRGADIQTYLKAREQTSQENRHQLNQNWRTISELIQGINTLFDVDAPFLDAQIQYQPASAADPKKTGAVPLKVNGSLEKPLRIWDMSGYEEGKIRWNEAAGHFIAGEITKLLDPENKAGFHKKGQWRPLRGNDIAILVRRNQDADLMQQVLRDWGIRSVTFTDQSVIDSEQSRDLQWLMEACLEPDNERKMARFLVTPLRGLTPEELHAKQQDEMAWEQEIAVFRELFQAWRYDGMISLVNRALETWEADKRLFTDTRGERARVNYLHLAELLQKQHRQLGGSPARLLKWFAVQRQDPQQRSTEDQQMRLESQEQLVQILTIHRSKGLEFPVVFCPFLSQGSKVQRKDEILTYHDAEDPEKTVLDLRSKEERTGPAYFRYYREQMAEEMRLAYVAITRAKQRCYLNWYRTGTTEQSPLAYLLMGRETYESWLHSKCSAGQSQNIDDRVYQDGLGRLKENGDEYIAIETKNQLPQQRLLRLESAETGKEQVREWQGAGIIEQQWRVQSYSSLARHDGRQRIPMALSERVDDYLDVMAAEPRRKEVNRFTFPAGAQAGTCLHEIMEELDFTRRQSDEHLEEQIQLGLRKHGFSEEIWTAAAQKMVRDTLVCRFGDDEEPVCLENVSQKQRLNELAFYYRVSGGDLAALYDIIAKDFGWDSYPEPVSDNHLEKGYLWGFIDLFFEQNGRYYIADYKSNLLGEGFRHYENRSLLKTMRQKDYLLQYYLYTIAVHRFLKQRLKSDYSYEKHFGGVAYLFMRGIRPEGEEMRSASGIYFHKPSQDVVEKLDALLLRADKNEKEADYGK